MFGWIRAAVYLAALPVLASCAVSGPSSAVHSEDVVALGQNVHVACAGEKTSPATPTVVLLSGLGSGSAQAWASIFPGQTDTLTARTCTVDRPGTGAAKSRTSGPNSPVINASEVVDALRAAGEPGPYVFTGWSYGGLVATLAANQVHQTNPADLAGLVLIDPTMPDEYRTLDTEGWVEGGVELDMAAGERAAQHLDFGDAPVIVVVAGENQQNVKNWAAVIAEQARTARGSQDFLVVVDPGTDHRVPTNDPAAVMAAIRAAVAASPAQVRMGGCDAMPDGLSGILNCLAAD